MLERCIPFTSVSNATAVFVCNGTVVDFLCTTITDIRSLIQSAAAFLYKVIASLVTGGTGSVLYPTKDNLAAGIGLFTMVAMDTEIFRIIKSTFVITVRQPVSSYLFRNNGRILA